MVVEHVAGVAPALSESPQPGAEPDPTEREAWAVLLSAQGLGPAGFGALLATYGEGRVILAAASRPGAAARFARIAAEAEGRTAFREPVGAAIVAVAAELPERLAVLRASGLTILTLDDPAYPARLRATDRPPPVLLVDGAPAALAADRAIAIVGTRRPTEGGRLVAARIAGALAKAGAAVISGLALGIDGAAHGAVLAEGGLTVALLGSGHQRLFPTAHRDLARSIVASGGAVVSELWPEQPASSDTFPQRNRLISGLADATIVVEAGSRSGALITARRALEQGRDLFIVPGPIDEPRSAGCLAWLREFPGAARIVATVPDLIADLGLAAEPEADGPPPTDHGTPRPGSPAPRRPSVGTELIELGETATTIGRALVSGHGSLDELVAATGHAPATVLGALTLLEMRGLVTTTYGRYRAAGRLAAAAPAAIGDAPPTGKGPRRSTR